MVDLIDDSDRLLGRASRAEVRARNLLHRSVAIFVRRTNGLIHVHRRSAAKDVYPGLYDMCVGGVVSSGETYGQAAVRELSEELGIFGVRPLELFQHPYRGARIRCLSSVYEVNWDGDIRLQTSELAWGDWMAIEDVDARLAVWEFMPDSLEMYRHYRQR